MKRKWMICVTGGMAAAAAVGIGIWAMHRHARDPEYVFSYAENQPEDYPTTLGAYEFARLVKEKTNGRIEILVYADGEMGDEKSIIRQVQYGGVDFTRVSISPLSDDFPKLNVLQLPFLYRDSNHMWSVLDGAVGEEFLHVFDGSQMQALSWYDAGARDFYCTDHSIETLEDMQGLKIRVQESNLMISAVNALGATAISMAYGEVYSAIQTGLIDGAENNWPSYESSGHYEVAPYITIDEHTRVPEVQLCSRATWEVLSEEDQEIIRECAEASARYERRVWKAVEKKSEQQLREKGVTITYLSEEEKTKFQKAEETIYQKYCSEYMDIVEEIRAVR